MAKRLTINKDEFDKLPKYHQEILATNFGDMFEFRPGHKMLSNIMALTEKIDLQEEPVTPGIVSFQINDAGFRVTVMIRSKGRRSEISAIRLVGESVKCSNKIPVRVDTGFLSTITDENYRWQYEVFRGKIMNMFQTINSLGDKLVNEMVDEIAKQDYVYVNARKAG